MFDENENLIKFLESVTTNLKNGSLNPKQVFRIGEFQMKWNFTNLKNNDITDEQMMKYCIMGWHVYYGIENKV